jgi:hypothetical protein
MANGSDEEVWASDKRDFVAHSRDETADERDMAADARDAVAHARDVIADARESLVDSREEALDASAEKADADTDAAVADRASAHLRRHRAAQDRQRTSADREQSRAAREAATARHADRTDPTLLALAFASIAEQLYDAQTYEEVLRRIAEAAVATISGSDSASVTLPDHGGYRTAASTDAAAAGVDKAQYDADQGPGLDALTTPMVDAASFPDERWPRLAAGPSAYGVESSLSYQLHLGQDDESSAVIGSLNIYGLTPGAFDQAAHEIGSILAAHASLAARAIGNRITLEDVGHHLQEALFSRDVIGQAKGILMERLKVTPEDAFDILKNSSQRLNLKLREVARELTQTGEVVSEARNPSDDASAG